MAKYFNGVNSPADFPHEQVVGLWHMPYTGSQYDRNRGGYVPVQVDGMFTIHRNLSLVKAQISSDNGEGVTRRGYKVYEQHGDDWVEVDSVDAGVFFKTDHPLWKNGAAPKGPQAVSDDAVADAIASILGTKGH